LADSIIDATFGPEADKGIHDLIPLCGHLDRIGVCKDRLHRRHMLRGDRTLQVSHEIHPAPLPRSTGELLCHSSFQI